MSAAVYIPLAKLLDLWGRAEGFAVMVSFATLGMILMAGSNGLFTFCAAQVLPYTLANPHTNKLLTISRSSTLLASEA